LWYCGFLLFAALLFDASAIPTGYVVQFNALVYNTVYWAAFLIAVAYLLGIQILKMLISWRFESLIANFVLEVCHESRLMLDHALSTSNPARSDFEEFDVLQGDDKPKRAWKESAKKASEATTKVWIDILVKVVSASVLAAFGLSMIGEIRNLTFVWQMLKGWWDKAEEKSEEVINSMKKEKTTVPVPEAKPAPEAITTFSDVLYFYEKKVDLPLALRAKVLEMSQAFQNESILSMEKHIDKLREAIDAVPARRGATYVAYRQSYETASELLRKVVICKKVLSDDEYQGDDHWFDLQGSKQEGVFKGIYFHVVGDKVQYIINLYSKGNAYSGMQLPSQSALFEHGLIIRTFLASTFRQEHFDPTPLFDDLDDLESFDSKNFIHVVRDDCAVTWHAPGTWRYTRKPTPMVTLTGGSKLKVPNVYDILDPNSEQRLVIPKKPEDQIYWLAEVENEFPTPVTYLYVYPVKLRDPVVRSADFLRVELETARFSGHKGFFTGVNLDLHPEVEILEGDDDIPERQCPNCKIIYNFVKPTGNGEDCYHQFDVPGQHGKVLMRNDSAQPCYKLTLDAQFSNLCNATFLLKEPKLQDIKMQLHGSGETLGRPEMLNLVDNQMIISFPWNQTDERESKLATAIPVSFVKYTNADIYSFIGDDRTYYVMSAEQFFRYNIFYSTIVNSIDRHEKPKVTEVLPGKAKDGTGQSILHFLDTYKIEVAALGVGALMLIITSIGVPLGLLYYKSLKNKEEEELEGKVDPSIPTTKIQNKLRHILYGKKRNTLSMERYQELLGRLFTVCLVDDATIKDLDALLKSSSEAREALSDPDIKTLGVHAAKYFLDDDSRVVCKHNDWVLVVHDEDANNQLIFYTFPKDKKQKKEREPIKVHFSNPDATPAPVVVDKPVEPTLDNLEGSAPSSLRPALYREEKQDPPAETPVVEPVIVPEPQTSTPEVAVQLESQVGASSTFEDLEGNHGKGTNRSKGGSSHTVQRKRANAPNISGPNAKKGNLGLARSAYYKIYDADSVEVDDQRYDNWKSLSWERKRGLLKNTHKSVYINSDDVRYGYTRAGGMYEAFDGDSNESYGTFTEDDVYNWRDENKYDDGRWDEARREDRRDYLEKQQREADERRTKEEERNRNNLEGDQTWSSYDSDLADSGSVLPDETTSDPVTPEPLSPGSPIAEENVPNDWEELDHEAPESAPQEVSGLNQPDSGVVVGEVANSKPADSNVVLEGEKKKAVRHKRTRSRSKSPKGKPLVKAALPPDVTLPTGATLKPDGSVSSAGVDVVKLPPVSETLEGATSNPANDYAPGHGLVFLAGPDGGKPGKGAIVWNAGEQDDYLFTDSHLLIPPELVETPKGLRPRYKRADPKLVSTLPFAPKGHSWLQHQGSVTISLAPAEGATWQVVRCGPNAKDYICYIKLKRANYTHFKTITRFDAPMGITLVGRKGPTSVVTGNGVACDSDEEDCFCRHDVFTEGGTSGAPIVIGAKCSWALTGLHTGTTGNPSESVAKRFPNHFTTFPLSFVKSWSGKA